MNIPYLCVFIVFLLIYFPKILQTIATIQAFSTVNNKYPRDDQARLTGWGKRAAAAHFNGLEIFPAFAVAVIIAQLQSVDLSLLSKITLFFVFIRFIYIFLYLLNLDILRTLSWLIQFGIIVWLFSLAIF